MYMGKVYMIKLRGDDVLLWREENKHKVGIPSKAPHLFTVSRYECYDCKKVFYYKPGDPQTPQYITISNKPDKNGIARGAAICHRCWHQRPPKRISRRSDCWLCDIQQALRSRRNGEVQHTSSIQELGTVAGAGLIGTQSVPISSQQDGVPGGAGVPKRRRGRKNKTNRKSR